MRRPAFAGAVVLILSAACEGPPARPAVSRAPAEPDASCPAGVLFTREGPGDRALLVGRMLVMGGVTATVKVSIEGSGDEEDEERARDAASDALREVARIEGLLSPFDPESPVARLARAPAGDWVELAPETAEVLSVSKWLWSLTGGAFDVTVGPVVRAYGFHTGAGPRWPDDEELAEVRARVGMGKLELDAAGARARCLAPGMRIDTGAVAKGYAVDGAAAVLERLGRRGALVEIGGEVRAIGRKPGGRAWRIGVENPRPRRAGGPFPGGPVELVAEIEIPLEDTEGGLASAATSADTYQYFEREGRRYSHVVDPRTGRPVSGGVVSATVLARECAVADGLATAFCVMGEEEALRLASKLPGVECVLLVETAGGGLDLRATEGVEKALTER